MFSNPSRTHTKWISITCLVVMLAVLVTGCAGPAPTPTAVPPKPAEPTKAPVAAPTAVPPTATPKKAVVLKMARSMEPFSVLVPWMIDDNPAVFLSVNIYDTLLRVSKDGFSVEPGLASKWESSADGLTWTFTLRDGLKFSDGTALKASDAKASLDMVRTGEKSITWKDSYAAIKEIQAPDDKTLKVILSQPYAPILSTMALFAGAVLPEAYAKSTEAKDFDPNTAWKTKGSGAYYCEGWKKGEVIVLKRNPYYWKGTPTVDEVRIEYIPDDNTRVLKLQGGEVDVIDFVPLSQIAALGAQPNIKAQAFPIQQSTFIILNTAAKPLDDVKVRQALNYATD
ncbi:MAG: ABC transporter substrate-binding protein, partial [Chloroflexota bacterium]|nr:ABC transporter substrate-binding protein [Chloroflexota bacterium]